MSSTSVIVESKRIYTSTLTSLLQPVIYLFIKSMWNQCKDTPTPFRKFQSQLHSVRSWDSAQIKDFGTFVTNQLEKDPEFDLGYFSKLLHVIFKLSIKTLNIVNDLEVTSISLPSNKRFFYNCLVNSCRQFYNNPYVFESNRKVSSHQLNVNINQRKELVKQAICDTIQHFLPIKKILCDPENILVINLPVDTEEIHDTELPKQNSDNESEYSIQLIKEPVQVTEPLEQTIQNPPEQELFIKLI